MLLVKTSLKLSKIHGIGVFTEEEIPKGKVIWKFDPRFDLIFSIKEIEKMPDIQKQLVQCFAFLSKKSNKYIYSIDNSRFTNHSNKNNVDFIYDDEPEGHSVANKDIEIGQEMTVDYRMIDAWEEKNINYLK